MPCSDSVDSDSVVCSDSVVSHISYVSSLTKELVDSCKSFKAGCINSCFEAWSKITSDSDILHMVKGLKIELNSFDNCSPGEKKASLSVEEKAFVDAELLKLEAKGVISKCVFSDSQNVSPIFTCPKKDGSHRLILNLKKLNVDIPYKHFKMDSLQTALQLVTPGCFMTSVDLKDAYYSVPIHTADRLLLRFVWKDVLWEFNAMPNGLALAPRMFTKLLKPVFSNLRASGFASTSFIDDSLQVSPTFSAAAMNVKETVKLLTKLGFVIHPEKSVLVPTQKMVYLGVEIDSVNMKVRLTFERALSIFNLCNAVLDALNNLSIRRLAQVIGKLIASFPAVKYGALHFRYLEECKKSALKENRGNFEGLAFLSVQAINELKWWKAEVMSAENDILINDPDIVITSDASLSGWGGVCNGVATGGAWLPEEYAHHINYLEIKAAFFTLKSFAVKLEGKHVRIMLDNSTAVACIAKMGTSHSKLCNELIFELWNWCIPRNIWLSTAHIPGKLNTAADEESRKINFDAEWKLNPTILVDCLSKFDFVPDIDLFASRVNAQFDKYVSFKADPEAFAVDAFTLIWTDLHFYAFPPFSVLLRFLRKVKRDRASGVLVVPDWPAQVWWPELLRLLVIEPIKLTTHHRVLSLPQKPGMKHPLLPKLQLLVCKISGLD